MENELFEGKVILPNCSAVMLCNPNNGEVIPVNTKKENGQVYIDIKLDAYDGMFIVIED
jgi:hypothetical protein